MTDMAENNRNRPDEAEIDPNADAREATSENKEDPARSTHGADGLKDHQRNPLAPPTNVGAGS